jgi:thiol-disulfide isomerase/thioredoxin
MRMKMIFIISYFCFLLIANGYAQESIRRLYIGDKVPDVIFYEMHNYSGKNGRLSDFKGKYIILDFWNKTCTNCIAAFPKMQHLQEKFKDDIQVLLIGYDSLDALKPLFSKSPIVKNTTLPMVLGRKQDLWKLFPHSGEPYQVWIDRNGIVRATTDGMSATEENFQDLIANKSLKVPIREDLLVDDLPEFDPFSFFPTTKDGRFLKYLLYYRKLVSPINKDNSISELAYNNELREPLERKWGYSPYYTMIMKSIKGYLKWGEALLLDSVSMKPRGLVFIQQSIPDLYSYAYEVPKDTKVLIKGGGEEYFNPKDGTALDRAKWIDNYTFTYGASIPDYSETNLTKIMKKDLIHFFGLEAELIDTLMPCLLLLSTGGNVKLYTKGGDYVFEDTKGDGVIFKNCKFNLFLSSLKTSYYKSMDPIFINESGIDPNRPVDMVIKSDFRDIPALNIEIAKYGLTLKNEHRIVKVLMIKKSEYTFF